MPIFQRTKVQKKTDISKYIRNFLYFFFHCVSLFKHQIGDWRSLTGLILLGDHLVPALSISLYCREKIHQ